VRNVDLVTARAILQQVFLGEDADVWQRTYL